MTTLWLVRHGQTNWNVEGRWQGHADPPLNVRGLAQAEALAAQLEGAPLAAIYSSDLERARVTAELIAQRLGLPVKLDVRLREIDQGEWEGLTGPEVAEHYPAEHAARQRDPLHTRAPGGETSFEVAGRVWAAADDIARMHPAGPVLVVSHGFALATLICRSRGLPLSEARQLIPDNAKIERLNWPPGQVFL